MKIFCKNCRKDIFQHEMNFDCGFRITSKDGIHSFIKENTKKNCEEVTRDRQAEGYLRHIKMPSQSKFFDRFVSKIPTLENSKSARVVLDLGCGPGPTVKILVEHGYDNITAIDFSKKSLFINKEHNISSNNINWVQADLQHLIFEPNSVDILVMSDFIQHIGSHYDKITLIENALRALKPGGSFYLSFFNFNLINYFKGDVHGTFSNGSIPYERLIPSEIFAIVNNYIKISRAYPMNITQRYMIDNFIGYFPFLRYIARMFAYEGIKRN